jgi:hypothetical protein
MRLNEARRALARALVEGKTPRQCVDEGIVSQRSLDRWDLDELVRAYRTEQAPPLEEVDLELRSMAPDALRTMRELLGEGSPQTRLLAARYVLDAVRAMGEADKGDDSGVAELRAILGTVMGVT